MVATGRRNPREARGARSPYWSTGPGVGVNVEGMKEQSDLDAWRPALSHSMRELAGEGITVLKILELCAGCKSVSIAAAKEAQETYGIERVEVFSLDGKPGTDCTRCVDILTYDWAHDEELRSFRWEREEGVRYLYYAHASPPCGPYSSMASRHRGPLSQRDMRWGDSVAQRCLELIGYFNPHFWTLESRGPPGLDYRPFMRALEPLRSTVNFCRYGLNRWKATSIWTNVQGWTPEPRCLCRLSQCCEHFRAHGKHLDRVQKMKHGSKDYAALPDLLVRSWTHAALMSLSPPLSSEAAQGT